MRRTTMIKEKFAGAPLFAGLTRRQLTPIAAHADRLTIRAGRVLAEAGASALELMVILEGTAIEDRGAAGSSRIGAGVALAPDAVARRGAFPATVTASTDVEILVVNGPSFRSAVHQHAVLAERVAAASRPSAQPRSRERAPRSHAAVGPALLRFRP